MKIKTRLLCLFLGALMCCGLLASCGGGDTDEIMDNISEEAAEAALTLAVWMPTETAVSEETELAMEKAVSKLTKEKYKVAIDFTFVEADDYYDALEDAWAEYDELRAAGKVTTTEGTTSETAVDLFVRNEETGTLELKYPDIEPYQVDLFYFSGADRLAAYRAESRLRNVDTTFTEEAKRLYDYIQPDLMNYIKVLNGNSTYAIPSNHVIGEYTYLLVDKALATKYHYGEADFDTLDSDKLSAFLNDVKLYEEGYYPLYIKDILDLPLTKFWSVDSETLAITDEFSLLVSSLGLDDTLGANMTINTVFQDEAYLSQLTSLISYRENGFLTSQDTAKYGAAVVKGNAELVETYGDDYYMIVLEKPTVTEDALYTDMWGVNYYSKNVYRCMEILTYFMTDVEIQNILTYGLAGVDYYVEDDQVVRYSDTDYLVNPLVTGNALMGYTEAGELVNLHDYQKAQNLDVNIEAALTFKLSATSKVAAEDFEHLQNLTDAYRTRLSRCRTVAELEALIVKANAELAEDAVVQKMLNSAYTVSGTEGASLATLYQAWLVANKYVTN